MSDEGQAFRKSVSRLWRKKINLASRRDRHDLCCIREIVEMVKQLEEPASWRHPEERPDCFGTNVLVSVRHSARHACHTPLSKLLNFSVQRGRARKCQARPLPRKQVAPFENGLTAVELENALGLPNHLVSDGRVSQGAPGEAVFAGELLLASLVSCGLGLVLQSAIDRNEPKPQVELTAEFLRNSEDPTRFASLTLIFSFTETERALAEHYVGHFTSKCPIYNTLNRGGPVIVQIEALGT